MTKEDCIQILHEVDLHYAINNMFKHAEVYIDDDQVISYILNNKFIAVVLSKECQFDYDYIVDNSPVKPVDVEACRHVISMIFNVPIKHTRIAHFVDWLWWKKEYLVSKNITKLEF